MAATGLAGGAADPAGPTAAPGSTRSARAPGTTWWRAACPRDRIRVIHPGVDAAAFTPAGPGGRRTADPTFLYVGRLKRYKGVEYAIRALALARTRAAGPPARHRGRRGRPAPAASSWPGELGQGDAVRFLGLRERGGEAARSSAARWANVFPSPKEGWGITIMEAAACGTPSLASDSPGLRDSVRARRDRIPGAARRSRRRWPTRMLELAGDPALVDRLGQAGPPLRGTADLGRAPRTQTEAQLQDIIAVRDLR